MQTPSFDQLLEATCHFGHLKRKWNPAMAPYIFMERNGIHIIDLYKTQAKLEEAAARLCCVGHDFSLGLEHIFRYSAARGVGRASASCYCRK